MTSPARWRSLHGPLRAVTVTLVVGTVVTGTVAVVPAFRFADVRPDLRIAMDTAQAMVGALVAYLLFGWFRRTEVVNHLAVSYALALVALTNLFFALLPTFTDGPRGAPSVSWGPLAARTISSLVLALAALVGDRTTTIRRPARALALALAGTVAVLVAVIAPLAPHLPAGVEVVSAPGDSRQPVLEGDARLLALQLVMSAAYGAAAIGFLRRARLGHGGLTPTLAVACTIAMFVRLNYFLYPSIYSDVVHLGDFFRLAFFVVLLSGAAREINAYWASQATAMAIAERQRLARDLHDGLTQDLAFIRSHTSSLAAGRGHPEMLEHIATAAGRALSESRRVVSALSAPVDGTLREILEFAATSIASREGTAVTVEAPDVEVAPHVREHVAWIVREAVSNAVRHGRARAVTVRAALDDGTLCVTVEDNGSGFDTERARGRIGGTGLRMMAERAAAVGGDLVVRSSDGSADGTAVHLRVPVGSAAQPSARGRSSADDGR